MPEKMPVSEKLFAEAVALAEEASKLSLKWFASPNLEVEEKDDGSPVTAADRAVEDFLRSEIAARWPADAIVGEERDDQEGSSGRTWFIDPIDGTKSFAHGVPLYATLLALCDEEGRPAIGVISLPALGKDGETVAAGAGLGCFHNGQRCQVLDAAQHQIAQPKPAKSKVVCLSGMEYLSEEAKLRLAKSDYIVRTWGDAYGYYLVATGKISAMLDDTMCPWDVAPLAMIIPEAKGRISSWSGAEIDIWNSPSVLATNGEPHEDLIALLDGSQTPNISPRS